MPAKQCPDCGRENDLGAPKCLHCGATQPESREMANPPAAEPEARSVVLAKTQLDRDLDGQLDEKILFDPFGTFLRVEPMK